MIFEENKIDNTENKCPQNEWEYFLELSLEASCVAKKMMESTNEEESCQLSKKYLEIQKWIADISFVKVYGE